MALHRDDLPALLKELQLTETTDQIRAATHRLYQELIDAEATASIGAGPWQRSDDRSAQRNGSRPRTLATRTGDLELRIPKLRAGSLFPSLLERRRWVDKALYAVVMEAYLHSTSTCGEATRRARSGHRVISASWGSGLPHAIESNRRHGQERSASGRSF